MLLSLPMELELTTIASERDAKAISQGVVEFNRQSVPGLENVEDEIRFFIFAKDANRVVGGIRAVCFWNTLHIELLWLAAEIRGSGVGSKMLAMAEAFAVERGYANALVETTSWQARPFYEKQGYVLMATIAGRPKGHASHYLHKSLA